MKAPNVFYLSLVLLIARLAMAQVPCGPTITPSPTLFVNWAQYQFDAAHSGCNPYESILGINTVQKLQLEWHSDYINLPFPPAIANGIVYASWQRSYPPNWGVYALNAFTGNLIWQFAPGDFVNGSPAVADGLVYIPTDSGIEAVDARTGRLVWRGGRFIDSSPAVSNGVVYATSVTLGYVYAFNAFTGAQIWSSNVAPGAYGLSPAVANGMVYIGGQGNNLYALNAATGEIIWKYTTGGGVASSAAVANGVVYVGSADNNLYALNANTGAFIWKYTTGGPVSSSAAVANGVVYFGTGQGSFDYNLYAVNASTGSLLWKFTAGDFVTSPVVANGVVYFSSWDGIAHVLNARTGAPLWENVNFASYSSLVVANGMVYFIGDYIIYEELLAFTPFNGVESIRNPE